MDDARRFEIEPRGPYSLAASTRFLEGFAPAAYEGADVDWVRAEIERILPLDVDGRSFAAIGERARSPSPTASHRSRRSARSTSSPSAGAPTAPG